MKEKEISRDDYQNIIDCAREFYAGPKGLFSNAEVIMLDASFKSVEEQPEYGFIVIENYETEIVFGIDHGEIFQIFEED